MGFFEQLTEKPWVSGHGGTVDLHDRRAFFLPKATLALRIFLVVVAVLFSLLVVAYADRMGLGDWRPLPEPWLLWLNTVMLIMSSFGFQWASMSARQGRMDGVKAGLLGAGGFTLAFLLGQLWAWQQLVDLGYFASTNPANGFFYLVTAVHGLHLLGGLVAWGRTAEKVWSGFAPAKVSLSVDLCAVYWHFLLVVWLILFVLLLFT